MTRRRLPRNIVLAVLTLLLSAVACRCRCGVLADIPPCTHVRVLSHRPCSAPTGIDTDEDTWWKDTREPAGEVAARGNRLMETIMALPQRHIMLVTHSSLLLHTLNATGIQPELVHTTRVRPSDELRPKFTNAEMRSAVVFCQPPPQA